MLGNIAITEHEQYAFDVRDYKKGLIIMKMTTSTYRNTKDNHGQNKGFKWKKTKKQVKVTTHAPIQSLN